MATRPPWIPSPLSIVRTALRQAWINSCDIVYDLGAGDGRVVVLSVAEFNAAKAIGIEIDPALSEIIRFKAREKGVEDKVIVIEEDFFKVPLSDATLVYLYLYKSTNEMLRPKLEKELHDGARIVTIDFPIPGWIPVTIKRSMDESGILRSIYVYIKGISENKDSKRIMNWDSPQARALLGTCSLVD